MKPACQRLILGLFLFSLACTKATPEFEVLDEDRVPRPMFSGSTVKSLQTYSDALTFQINGECDPKVRNIIGSATGSTASIASAGINVTCGTDKKFSFVLKSLNELGFTATEGQVYEIQLRSSTAGGMSKPSFVRILFTSAAGGNRPVLVTSGGTGANLATDGFANGISASIRISNKMNGRATAAQANAEEAFLKTDGTPNGISAHVGVRINH